MTIIDFNHHESGSHPVMLMVAHVVAPLVLGSVMTVGLFYVMQSLIASDRPAYSKQKDVQLVNFVRVPQMSQVQTRDIRPQKPPPPERMPRLRTSMNFNVPVHAASFSMKPAPVAHQARLTEGWTFASDGNYMPIVKVAPIYPTSAEMASLEGWVVLSFDINKEGRVVDAEVVDDCAQVAPVGQHVAEACAGDPNSIFDASALNAARRFKYRPRVIDGKPVMVTHVRHKFVFVLDN